MPKSQNPYIYEDYHQILLLYHLGKLTEKVIKTRLTYVILGDFDTQHALVDIVTNITAKLDEKPYYGAGGFVYRVTFYQRESSEPVFRTVFPNMNRPQSVFLTALS